MITNIRFSNVVDVSPTSTEEFRLSDGEVISKSTVPAVIYKLHNYYINELEFVKSQVALFDRSLHIAEVRYDGNYTQEITALKSLEHVAIFLHIVLDDADVEQGTLSEEKATKLTHMKEDARLSSGIDRVILEDQSTSLHTEVALKLRKAVAELTGVKEDIITLDNSPVIVPNTESGYLTALIARKLGAIYGQNENLVIATKILEEEDESGSRSMRCVDITDALVGTEPKVVRSTTKVKSDTLDGFMNKPTGDKAEKEKKVQKKAESKKSETKVVKPKLPKGVLLRY